MDLSREKRKKGVMRHSGKFSESSQATHIQTRLLGIHLSSRFCIWFAMRTYVPPFRSATLLSLSVCPTACSLVGRRLPTPTVPYVKAGYMRYTYLSTCAFPLMPSLSAETREKEACVPYAASQPSQLGSIQRPGSPANTAQRSNSPYNGRLHPPHPHKVRKA